MEAIVETPHPQGDFQEGFPSLFRFRHQSPQERDGKSRKNPSLRAKNLSPPRKNNGLTLTLPACFFADNFQLSISSQNREEEPISTFKVFLLKSVPVDSPFAFPRSIV